MGTRFTAITGAVLLLYGALLFNLYQKQVVHNGTYLAQAESQENAANFETSRRGAIYLTDKNNGTLAVALNKDFAQIYAVPKKISDTQETAHALSLVLGIPAEDIVNKLADLKSSMVPLFKKASDETVSKINDLELSGVGAVDVPGRFYPFNTLAAQTIGFTGPDSKQLSGETGRYGLERYYNDMLSGGDGDGDTPSIAGKDLFLTIDPNIQNQAESLLAKLVGDNKATGGSIMVAEPKTGKLLAIASLPTFDPNAYSSFGLKTFLNPVVEHTYEPGSVFKVFTMAAGIDAGKITPDTTYYDTGSVTVSGKKITNYDLKSHGAYGKATMTNVIEHSINTGAVFAESKIGNDIFTAYLKKFGLNEKTGVDLPGELAGNLKQLTPKAPKVAFATASYGQGVAVTPLELLNAMAMIANDGTLMRPYVNSELSPQAIRRALSTSTADAVTKMMISAVDKAGIAAIDGYSVAGKTGTAFIPDLVHGGYTDNVIDSFVGFAPASNPRFIALIKLDTLPSTAIAATNVVPAFKEIAQYLINYYNIPPDRINSSQ